MAIIKDVLKNEHGDNITMYIEVDDEKMSAPAITPKDLLPPLAQDSFAQAMSLIRTCSSQVAGTVQALPEEVRPRRFEVAFAVKIDAQFGAILAKVSGEAQLQVTLIWGELT